MVHVYVRCNSGHYFEGTHCPLDGWSSPASVEVAAAVAALGGQGIRPSIDTLRTAGLSTEAIERCIVVEFGNDASVFESIAPEGYIVGGKWVANTDFDARFR